MGQTADVAVNFRCPICGVDNPHEHTSVEIAEHRIKTAQRAKLHWHLENKNHATATGHSYYPSIVSGEGTELGYAGGDTATKIIEEHNRVVDLMLGFTTPVPPMTIHGKDHKPLRGESSAIWMVDDDPS
jgi:hypothetical protein